ncbi:MAG: isocitrate lyase/PEP mutase family protein [Chloroflexi bacterium]|nr:isocitrate lyase/PEP mutase family protein [Chloroflexota bacterium]MBI2983846.1 isocitrate lyase/PEP mutase family protein [Chloroflexota bacterium]
MADRSSALLPSGLTVPASRSERSSTRFRRLLDERPYVLAPGVYDPMTAEIAMYHGFDAVYFSGYSFAVGYLGTTDMDIYSSTEIADGARRTVQALRKFQLTMAVGDPDQGIPPRRLEIPPLVVDMDAGYGNVFNVQRTTELYVNAGVAAAHIEDQVTPKRCGHIAGKALVSAGEMVGKLRMARAVADDLGSDMVIIARTDGVSAVDAPETTRGLDLAIERGLRYLDSGAPDLIWAELPTSGREPAIRFAEEVHRRFPDARFGFNYSSSFRWDKDPDPISFEELGELGYEFIFITLAAQHSASLGIARLFRGLRERGHEAYVTLQREEWAEPDLPTKSHHFFSGVPYHQHVGKAYDAGRLGADVKEDVPEETRV